MSEKVRLFQKPKPANYVHQSKILVKRFDNRYCDSCQFYEEEFEIEKFPKYQELLSKLVNPVVSSNQHIYGDATLSNMKLNDRVNYVNNVVEKSINDYNTYLKQKEQDFKKKQQELNVNNSVEVNSNVSVQENTTNVK